MNVIGLMSGTSLDGIDAVLMDLENAADGLRWEVRHFRTRPYDASFRATLLDAVEGGGPEQLCGLHAELGERFAVAVADLLSEAGLAAEAVACIGSHGQTVWHTPPTDGRRGATLQLGDPATIAERTGIAVVSDFRTRDMAAGGQGAPLVPAADRLLFSHPRERRALQNLGGMANVTWLDVAESPGAEVLAFDTGPGCALIDAAVDIATGGRLRYDESGAMARAGEVDEALLERLLAAEFFAHPPPKSTGRERFGRPYVEQIVDREEIEAPEEWTDLIATLTELTARSVADAYRRWVVPKGLDAVYLMGGGSRNPALVDAIGRCLAGIPVRDGSALGMNPDAREAAAFAVLAWTHLEGVAGNEYAATGATGPRVLGSFTPGRAPASAR